MITFACEFLMHFGVLWSEGAFFLAPIALRELVKG